jgi:biopolymer transport protein TolQ
LNISLSQDLSFLSLVTNASVVVQLVLLLLLLASLISWWYIFLKQFAIKNAVVQSEAFEREFWSGADLNTLYQQASGGRAKHGSMERIFEAGFREFMKLKRQPGMDVKAILDGSRRAMRATYHREMDTLESHLSFLATVGSVSPYVGLLGTVWGIMNAFRGLSNVVQATLAHVAPGIAEALVATAMGLFAAIPAVVAYNRYTHDIDRLAIRFDSFMEEFSNILQRQVHA